MSNPTPLSLTKNSRSVAAWTAPNSTQGNAALDEYLNAFDSRFSRITRTRTGAARDDNPGAMWTSVNGPLFDASSSATTSPAIALISMAERSTSAREVSPSVSNASM